MLKGYIDITRPGNSVVAGFAVLLGVIIATGTISYKSLILIPIVALITAAGNTINDYCDRDIDAVNRPKRPIPSGTVSPHGALVFSAVLFLAGIFISFFANLICFLIAVFNSFLLVVYAKKLKSLPLVGNVAVSYLSASIFLFGGAIFGIAGLLQNAVVFSITFFAMLSRELLKDAEDIEGDKKGGAKTLPMYIGVKKTGGLSLILVLTGVCISLLPLFRFWGPYYLVMIIIADAVIVAAAFKGFMSDDSVSLVRSGSTSLLKKGMFLALLIFLVSAVLFG
ncbi:geranylgeranylglycerol-phosphate geranylgeranyltransferase [Methanomicrobium sp. W14]|uniref:geranylgeranylglycerol-phosphate geranylgeranyltransferase n=1 Tax=Methanomicrobium sp. W14 TaxID=2817839 RepID=UPI001AE9EE1B|nr:geranylgeranylglycerol-phosphate geranylgeranyltransferase [Methanomicrobium sp. W14]MBP2132432.1 geranylgeranylglycerol-phosphate geranylgeranyltransferase [Methanomicrobium sp. W14]